MSEGKYKVEISNIFDSNGKLIGSISQLHDYHPKCNCRQCYDHKIHLLLRKFVCCTILILISIILFLIYQYTNLILFIILDMFFLLILYYTIL